MLRIHALGARDLEKKDVGLLGKGKSDPFCEITGMMPISVVVLLYLIIRDISVTSALLLSNCSAII